MAAKPLHLGWFLQGSSAQAWGECWTGHIGTTWMVPELFIDLARSLERACFDYVLIEDSSYVGESWGGSTELYLKHAIAVPRPGRDSGSGVRRPYRLERGHRQLRFCGDEFRHAGHARARPALRYGR